ncbi:MAG: ATP-grasp domain-containing protein [Proteobacteria bacterium]|nr:ATP-grasp domain-containing protein [Pseudomonadota bacterium]
MTQPEQQTSSQPRAIRKILIANRGAIARRIVRACNELGLESVVVHTSVDAHAPYIDEASEAHALRGLRPADSYLDQEQLLGIARTSGADAVHPGYGFLSENAGFAQKVIDAGLTFIGPDPVWLERMGDKVNARRIMAEQGMPVFDGSDFITDLATAHEVAQTIGFPLVVKPSGGGGGMGMQVVEQMDALESALTQAQAVAAAAFGSSDVYLERWIARPRHIEYQILADEHGNAMHLYERECSIQRRHQKLIEESPAPGIDASLLREQAERGAEICARLGYNNVGTLETLYSDGSSGFLEMNTRIQVEHGVTEEVTGVDLVQQQILLAAGGRLPEPAELSGHAIEVRLYAEDSQTLMPSTGVLRIFQPPQLFGVRVETGYQQGQEVSPYYDALLAKIIAKGRTREQAIGRAVVALQAFTIQGVQTNAALLLRVLRDTAFLRGDIDTGMVARILRSGQRIPAL